MASLKIIGIVLALALIGGGIYGFFETCKKKFDYHFFTQATFIAGCTAMYAGIAGKSLLNLPPENASSQNYGLILIAVCCLIMIVMAIRNFQHTNFWFGLFGTIIQFSLLGVAAIVIVGLLFLYVGMQALSLLGQSDSSDSDRQSPSAVDDDWLNSDQNPTSAYYDDSSYFTFK